MTIAAGFICNDGLVLATDLEVTESMIKRVGGKSSYFQASSHSVVAVAGAGYYHLVAYACERMEESVKGESLQQILPEVRKVIGEIYKQHVRPSYPSDQWDTALQLIIGIVVSSDQNFQYGLYVSSRTVLTQTGPYDFVGAGREIGYYIMKKKVLPNYPKAFSVKEDLRRSDLGDEIIDGASIDDAIPVIKEVMTEVEENVAYCGKGVKILRIPFFGQARYDPL